jgi:hypothetical protein
MNEAQKQQKRPYVEPEIRVFGPVEECTAHFGNLLRDVGPHRTLLL